MDNDDEMMVHVLMDEEAAIDAEEDENLANLACLLKIQLDKTAND